VAQPDARGRPGLPFRSQVFDVVLNRHEAFDPLEVRRIIKPHGRFLKEQVGSEETASVRALLGLPADEHAWTADVALAQLELAGWAVEEVHEDRLTIRFSDIAALIGYYAALHGRSKILIGPQQNRSYNSCMRYRDRSP
jgi:hypothetical protein